MWASSDSSNDDDNVNDDNVGQYEGPLGPYMFEPLAAEQAMNGNRQERKAALVSGIGKNNAGRSEANITHW
jgi:hypothetical protein